MENINKKIEELNLEQLKGYVSWLYVGDTYKDSKGNMYGVINGDKNKALDIDKDTHLYRIKTGEIVDEVTLTLVI